MWANTAETVGILGSRGNRGAGDGLAGVAGIVAGFLPEMLPESWGGMARRRSIRVALPFLPEFCFFALIASSGTPGVIWGSVVRGYLVGFAALAGIVAGIVAGSIAVFAGISVFVR